MEIVAILKKPYTMQEHDDFIMDYGQNCLGKHPHSYEINETETELQALGPTQDELDKQAKEAKIAKIKYELDQVDLKSIRAIRANDQEYIAKYEAEAEELRKELTEL